LVYPKTHLAELKLGDATEGIAERFPFTIPSLMGLDRLPFPGPVTVFVGENGSGKSTLLEAIAMASRLPTVGQAETSTDVTLNDVRRLADVLTLVWRARSHRGFFLRAEDFFGFMRRISLLKEEMREHLAEVEEGFEGASEYVKGLAKGPAASSIAALETRYGDLNANSHGESFLKLFESRLVPGGLYLLDEPEAALSPQSQLALIAMVSDMVEQGGQFIIATHSPLLMAIPGASIYSFDERPVGIASYDELDSVQLLKAFLQSPDRYLRHLWAGS